MRAHRVDNVRRHMHVARHRIGEAQHGALRGVEAIRVFPLGERLQLRLADALLQRQRRMLVGLVLRAVDDGHPHDHQLAQRARQVQVLPNGGQVRQPALGQRRAVQQHLVQVQHAAALRHDLLDQRPRFGRTGVGVGQSCHRASFVAMPATIPCSPAPRRPRPSLACLKSRRRGGMVSRRLVVESAFRFFVAVIFTSLMSTSPSVLQGRSFCDGDRS